MRLEAPKGVHLTYCTNIHPGETWPEVRDNLERYLPAVKARLSPDADFGVGLRLSGAAAEELGRSRSLEDLKSLLDAHGLYVFTINGFPYGRFHGAPVKEDVYLPDWRDETRLAYTINLADILAALLPAGFEADASISTVPCGFRSQLRRPGDVERAAAMMIRAVAHLVKVRAESGKTITLALEPEPCCYLETVPETLAFFEDHLFASSAVSELAARTGLSPGGAEAAMRRHIGICLDLCHAAVEFEDPQTCLAAIRSAGVRVGKIQISAGLRFAPVTARTVELLRPFDEPVYLHQVVARTQDGLDRFVDLKDAFASLERGDPAEEWRVHFHVPIFLDDLGEFGTTQAFLREVLASQRRDPISQHLEVETYTWDVLPDRYRGEGIVSSICREMEWAIRQLGAEGGPGRAPRPR